MRTGSAAGWNPSPPLRILLAPLAALYRVLATLRRAGYRAGLLQSTRLPVPVVVIGNITAGGTGKTPLVVALAAELARSGRHPGIVTRGYRGRNTGAHAVTPQSDPRDSGDEAVLLAVRTGCPVWAGVDRVAAGQALLAAHPECDLLLTDDGLQHYRLARAVEIAVVDGEAPFGNGWHLPAGPLREPPGRLAEVDAIVVHASAPGPAPGLSALDAAGIAPPRFHMHLEGARLRRLSDGSEAAARGFPARRVAAVAGIGRPERFFAHLARQGMVFDPYPFPDHHAFRPADLALPGYDAIVMTEKDAIKCRDWADPRFWCLPVTAEVDPGLPAQILSLLEGC